MAGSQVSGLTDYQTIEDFACTAIISVLCFGRSVADEMHASVLSVPVAAAICRIVRRNHSRSPHLREPVREIHSLRTGRFHGAPGRAMNLPCPITPHHETVTRLFREKSATGQPPSRNSRLHESHFTNPPPRKTARPNHQQARPVHRQARPVHKHDPEAKKLSTTQRTVSRPSCPISGPCRR